MASAALLGDGAAVRAGYLARFAEARRTLDARLQAAGIRVGDRVALMGIGSLVGALPAGVIADRFGEKKSLVGAMMLEQNDEWAVQRSRYMTLETIATMSDDPLISLPAAS